MNKALIFNTVHRLLNRTFTKLVMVGYGFFVLISVGTSSLSEAGNLKTASAAWFLCWALGSGLLGGERSDGYLPLLLSRPISRAQYLLSRWAGLLLCVLAIDLALQLLSVLFFSSNHTAMTVFNGGGIPFALLAQRWLWFAFFATLCSAWIAFLSAAFNGNGDLLYFTGISLVLGYLATKVSMEFASKSWEVLAWFWAPGGATQRLWMDGDQLGALYSGLIFIAAAGVSLATGVYIMQRRDVSYVNR
jgi:ABC-type transport system involved in multi-copper enzyme maturation permease subunit